jgi:fucose permease
MSWFERFYAINDTRAALVFPAGVRGYILATLTTPLIQSHTGRRGIAMTSSVCRLLFAVILSSQPLFPVFLISFAGLGYGTGLTDTAWNAWASGTPRPNVVSGFLHGSLSLGCVTGPTIVIFALRRDGTWRTFYIVLVRNSGISHVRLHHS